MKFYIAHNFAARDWLREEIKPQFEAAGHTITSRWITEDLHLMEENQAEAARHDIEDVERADGIVLFSDNFGDRPGRGKYVELGYAIGRNKILFVVGENTSCVFYNLPAVTHVQTVSEVLTIIHDRHYYTEVR